jgi:hypothetical protein
MIQTTQTALGATLGVIGAVFLVVANVQIRRRNIIRMRLITPHGKIVNGIFLILAGALIFLSQFLPHR